MKQILLSTIEGQSTLLDIEQFQEKLVANLKGHVQARFGLYPEDFFLEQENRVLLDAQNLTSLTPSTIYIKLRILGGKGGFGSLLRGQAPKKKYTNNFDACRDLSGRRLRQVNNEKKYAEWKKRKEEEEKFVEQEQHEYEAKKKELQAAIYANRYKIDEKYKKQLQKTAKSIAEGVVKAMTQAKNKRKMAEISILDDDDDLALDRKEGKKRFKEEEKVSTDINKEAEQVVVGGVGVKQGLNE